MKSLETHHLKKIKTFCQDHCQSILIEKSKKDIEYSRGLYKGFIYGIKSMNYLLSQTNIHIKKADLYIHFKEQQQIIQCAKFKEGNFNAGVKDSIYKIMNLVSTQE